MSWKLSSDSIIILLTSKPWVYRLQKPGFQLLLYFHASPILIASSNCPIKARHQNTSGLQAVIAEHANFQFVFLSAYWSSSPNLRKFSFIVLVHVLATFPPTAGKHSVLKLPRNSLSFRWAWPSRFLYNHHLVSPFRSYWKWLVSKWPTLLFIG